MLTHVNNENKAEMVDISSKEYSTRTAIAYSEIEFPQLMQNYFDGSDFQMKKGPVFQTAIIAATQAVKKTYELIPFCHQIPIDSIKIHFEKSSLSSYKVYCLVKSTYKTGVEMEALMGATLAALTVIDMCKAATSEIKILNTELVYKTGGKKTINKLPTYGLILTGGKSQRMNQDKALIEYHGKAQARHLYNLMSNNCDKVFLSSKKNQWENTELNFLPQIIDEQDFSGPIMGIISAMNKYPYVNWMIIACDLALIEMENIETLKKEFDCSKIATAYKNPEKGFPEALCAIYAPEALNLLKTSFKNEIYCPVKILKQANVKLIEANNSKSILNINTPHEKQEVLSEIN